MKYCYFNSKIIPVEKAFVQIDDIGILRGYGVFDFLRTYNGKPFLLEEHLTRLENSAKALSLALPLSHKKIEIIIEDLLKKNKVQNAQVRILLTGGKTVHGMGYDAKKPTFAILIEPLALLPAELYKEGAKVITDMHMRHVYSAKTTNYINAIALAEDRKKNDAVEILYCFNDEVLECSTSNFFLIKGKTLITPKENVLLGTTRNILLKLLKKEFAIEERAIKVTELKEADEAFLTATNKEILPIVKIDTLRVGTGKVGKNTKKIMELFATYTQNFGRKT